MALCHQGGAIISVDWDYNEILDDDDFEEYSSEEHGNTELFPKRTPKIGDMEDREKYIHPWLQEIPTLCTWNTFQILAPRCTVSRKHVKGGGWLHFFKWMCSFPA